MVFGHILKRNSFIKINNFNDVLNVQTDFKNNNLYQVLDNNK